MKKNILKSIIVSLGILLFQVTPLLAGFGVSPTNIYNQYLKPGGHFEKTVNLSRSDANEELLVTVEPSLGEIDSWFQFEPGMQFTFPRGQTRTSFKVIIDVPDTAGYRSFEGVIRVRATNPKGEVRGVSIVQGARLDVALVTTEENISDLLVRSLKMLDSVDGEPLQLEIVAENVGNVEVTPTAKITIMSLSMEELEILESDTLSSIKPNSTDTLHAEFYSTLPEGEYFVEAEVLLDDLVLRKERLVFRIVGQREAREDAVNQLVVDMLNFVKSNWIYMIAGLVLATFVYLLLTSLWESEKLVNRRDGKLSKFLGSIILTRLLISVLLSALLVLGGYFVINTFLVKEEVVEEESAELNIEIEGDDVVTVEDTVVKGAATFLDMPDDIDPFVVNIRDSQGNVQYPIYSEPSFSSDVIYYAQENESLAVLDEKANWYRVLIDGRVGGWLDKSMVKSSETKEVE